MDILFNFKKTVCFIIIVIFCISCKLQKNTQKELLCFFYDWDIKGFESFLPTDFKDTVLTDTLFYSLIDAVRENDERKQMFTLEDFEYRRISVNSSGNVGFIEEIRTQPENSFRYEFEYKYYPTIQVFKVGTFEYPDSLNFLKRDTFDSFRWSCSLDTINHNFK